MVTSSDQSDPAHRPYPKPIIGIVGGIGSGKSLVAGELKQTGCFIIDSDLLAHRALDEPMIRKQIHQWLGGEIIGTDGNIDRRKLGAVVFRNPVDIQRLNSLVHPRVEQLRREQMEAIRHDLSIIAVVLDSPLLMESGLHRQCDAIIFVQAPLDIRQKRVMESRGWNEAELARREKFQGALDKKKEIADHIIINDGEPALVSNQVRDVLTKVLARFGRIYKG